MKSMNQDRKTTEFGTGESKPRMNRKTWILLKQVRNWGLWFLLQSTETQPEASCLSLDRVLVHDSIFHFCAESFQIYTSSPELSLKTWTEIDNILWDIFIWILSWHLIVYFHKGELASSITLHPTVPPRHPPSLNRIILHC